MLIPIESKNKNRSGWKYKKSQISVQIVAERMGWGKCEKGPNEHKLLVEEEKEDQRTKEIKSTQ